MKKMQKHLGFTLIEILLVLVLLSLTAVAVIATLPTSQKDLSKQYAQSFFQRLQLLNEEAVLSGKDFGLRVDDVKSTYTLLSLTQDGWQPLELKQIPSETKLEGDISVQLELGGGAWGDDDRLFEPGSLFDEDMFAELEDKKKKKVKPHLKCSFYQVLKLRHSPYLSFLKKGMRSMMAGELLAKKQVKSDC